MLESTELKAERIFTPSLFITWEFYMRFLFLIGLSTLALQKFESTIDGSLYVLQNHSIDWGLNFEPRFLSIHYGASGMKISNLNNDIGGLFLGLFIILLIVHFMVRNLFAFRIDNAGISGYVKGFKREDVDWENIRGIKLVSKNPRHKWTTPDTYRILRIRSLDGHITSYSLEGHKLNDTDEIFCLIINKLDISSQTQYTFEKLNGK